MPEPSGNEVVVMKTIGVGILSSKNEDKRPESRQRPHIPNWPHYPFGFFSSARKDNGEDEQRSCRTCKRAVSPTHAVTRFRPKHEHQQAGHEQRKECVIPKTARLGERNRQAKYSHYFQEQEAGNVGWR